MNLFCRNACFVFILTLSNVCGQSDEEGSGTDTTSSPENSETTKSNGGDGNGLSSGDIALICIFVPIGTILLGMGFYAGFKYYKREQMRNKLRKASSSGQTPTVYAVGGERKSGNSVDMFEIRIGSDGTSNTEVTEDPKANDSDSLNNQAPAGMANSHSLTTFMQPSDVKYQVL